MQPKTGRCSLHRYHLHCYALIQVTCLFPGHYNNLTWPPASILACPPTLVTIFSIH